MKHTTLLLFFVFAIFYSSSVKAQKSSAILTFKDGTEVKGFGKIKSFGKVKFRKTRKGKATKYNFDDLQSVKIYEGGEINTYVYRSVKDHEFPKVLQLITEGKVTLYKIHTEGYYGTPNMGVGGFGGAGVGFGGNYYSMNSYYVKRDNEEEVTHLGSTHLFSKNFKKAASAYFKDCTSLVEKIQNKEFKKRHIREVVEYYNNDCH